MHSEKIVESADFDLYKSSDVICSPALSPISPSDHMVSGGHAVPFNR